MKQAGFCCRSMVALPVIEHMKEQNDPFFADKETAMDGIVCTTNCVTLRYIIHYSLIKLYNYITYTTYILALPM
jgi:hypothetical protein